MLSIIIPVFNQHDLTTQCIESVRMNTADYELVIVDNGSTPPFNPPFSGFSPTSLIRNPENNGFPRAVNQGIVAATGDVIVILNNDVIVTPGWSEKLITALEGFDIVGPVTNYCAGAQKVQAESYESIDGLYQAAAYWSETYQDAVQEVNFVIGFCMVFRKSLFDEIGPFDESIWPCSGEEVDFCFRAKQAGKRAAIVSGCYVHHEGSITFKDLQAAGVVDYRDLCNKVDAHIEKRWGADYWSRQEIGSSPAPAGLCLNLGCGFRRLVGFVNIDNREEVAPDTVCDVMAGLPYDDATVDMVKADDFLEHISIGKVVGVMEEIWRVLKPNGIFESSTPSTDGRGAFQDPTHVSFWNRNSWLYYSDPAYRNLYGIKADFKIESIEDVGYDNDMGIIHTHVIARAVK